MKQESSVRVMLAELDFRRLLRVRLSGQAGDGLFQGALFGAAFFNPESSTTAAEAAANFAALLLPYSLVGPFAGVLLDRWSRQRILMLSNAGRAVLLVALAISLVQTGPTSGVSIGIALLAVSVNRFVLSGLSASLPHVVADHRLVTANSFTTTLGTGAAALGGGLAVALREVFGKDDAGAARTALVAAAVYAGACILAGRLERRRLGPDGEPPGESALVALVAVARGLLQGAQHVRERAPAARALAAITAHRFFYGLSTIAILLLYTDSGAIHRGITGLGQVLVASVLGGLAAALVTPRVTRRIGTQRWIVSVFAAAALFEVFFGVPFTHQALLVAAVGLGFAAQAAKICVDTLLQEAIEDDFRGRVFSFYDTLFNVSFVSAAALAAVLVPDNGKSYVVLSIIAAGYAVTALVYGAFVRLRSPREPLEPIVTA